MHQAIPPDLNETVYRHWAAQRGARRMPARRDIDPAAIKGALPYLLILGVEGDLFRYRLVGTQVVEDFGRETSGTIVGSHLGSGTYRESTQSQYRSVRDTGQVIFAVNHYRSPQGAEHTVARLLMPLGEQDKVDRLLIVRAARFPSRSPDGIDWLAVGAGVVLRSVVITSVEQIVLEEAQWRLSTQDTFDAGRQPDR